MRLVAILLIGSVAACNTVKGAGRDIQKGGEFISHSAQKVKRAITD